jgi:aryl-alcohol dehydrogenase-like predicted oxidoreductase
VEYRRIGSLTVPVVGLGCNQFGTAACDEATSIVVVHEAIEAGVTYFDVADEYGQNYADPTDPRGWGSSEEILGRALRGRRDQVLIATKFGAHPHADRERGGASARARLFSEKTFTRLEALERFAGERGHSLLELAFAWLLAQPTVATVIAGAARPGQVSANAAAATWRLPPAEAAQAMQAVLMAA